MSTWFIVAVSVLYAGAMIKELATGNFGIGLMLYGYVVANIGLIISQRS